MAASPLIGTHPHDASSMSVLPSPQISNLSMSNQTLLTSHVKHPAEHVKVVAESPPTLVSPALDALHSTEAQVPQSQVPVNSSVDKRKSVPVKRTLPSVTEKPLTNTNNKSLTPGSAASRKRTRLNFTEPPQISPLAKILPPDISTASRDRSNSAPSSKKGKMAPQNTLIHDFFAVATSKATKTRDISAVTCAVETRSQARLAAAAATTFTGSPCDSQDKWQQRCQELEQLLLDRNEQLTAVSNNQTIMHTALRQMVHRLEKELEDTKKAKEAYTQQTAIVIEKLVRTDSAREAKELRDKLAGDGSRLGRIVYTRAGMRAVESWEDGYAFKELRTRKLELEIMRETLVTRREEASQATNELNEKRSSVNATELVAIDALSVMEAQESAEMHMETVKKQETILADEEQALNDEKANHIRAWKRLQSEEESRFRTRPKLDNRYVLLSLLGKGGFSEVWRAYDLNELREVAVKIHQLDPRWSDAKKDNYTKHVTREYEIHRDVRHPRIVSLFDVFEIDDNSFATVLECCKGTDLDALLKEKKRLPERDARAILLQILSGMQYLSQPSGNRQGIIHYDLKPGNILFDEFGDAKITDFGLSKIVDTPDPAESMELTSQGAGTYWYLPPECFVTNETVRISNKVDVFSIGVIYYQMLFGRRPFGDGMSQDKVLTDHTMLNAREVKFPDRIVISDQGKDFIRQALMYDQAFRPTIAQLCQNSYVTTKLF